MTYRLFVTLLLVCSCCGAASEQIPLVDSCQWLNKVNIEMHGNTQWNNTWLGRVAAFDGSPDNILQVAIPSALVESKAGTLILQICVWQLPSTPGQQMLLAESSGQWKLTVNSLGNIQLQWGQLTLEMTSLVKPDVWNQWAVVWSQLDGTLQLYCDGVVAATGEIPADSVAFSTDGSLMLGGHSKGMISFCGAFGDVKAYATPFSDAMVQQANELPMVTQHIRRQIFSDIPELAESMDRPKLTLATFEAAKARAVRRLKQLTGIKDALIYVVAPTSSRQVLPYTILDMKDINNQIHIAAAPGEFEPASFVVRPERSLTNFMLTASDLKGTAGMIPSENVDIKVVKCHYQAETAWRNIGQNKSSRRLTPELLLNDASLLKVDEEMQNNYLKLRFPNGEKYISINDTKDGKNRWNNFIPNATMPVQDAPDLQPLFLRKDRNQQFWITVKVPEQAKPGLYIGTITMTSAGQALGELTLSLRVWPFKLMEPATNYDLSRPLTCSIYYLSVVDPESTGDLAVMRRSWKQMEAEMKNLREHGVSNPTIYQLQPTKHLPACSREVFVKLLKLRKDAGLKTKPVYLTGPEKNLLFHKPKDHKTLAKLKARAVELMDWVEEAYGHRDIYFYALDEASGPELLKQRPAWKAIHEVGGKVFVSTMDLPGPSGANAVVGDLLDLPISSRPFNTKYTSAWHKKGKRIWNYGNPQGGIENPDLYRRGYGLTLYFANYDGAATYAYFEASGNPWNDFDSYDQRDINFVYPTIDGVVDTIAWEGYREGIDDIRYATTLRYAIQNALRSSDQKKRQMAKNAERWLSGLNPAVRNLDRIRREISEWIIKLQHSNQEN